MEVNFIEPLWKLIVASKGLLPLLWEMFPNHKNLLPAYFDDPKSVLGETNFSKSGINHWISKPMFGREGQGVFTSKAYNSYDEFVNATESEFGRDSKTNEKLGKSIY